MGVGKTTVCKKLLQQMEKTVWLDGDWCWMMNPWNIDDDNKEMVIRNIKYILKNYLQNSHFENIIFSWVIHEEKIFDLILDDLQDFEFKLFKITLICREDKLLERMNKDNRDMENIQNSIKRTNLFNNLNTFKIDTSESTPEEVAEKILTNIGYKNNL